MAKKEVRICEVCGIKFEGYPTSKYCRECRPVVERENKRARERFRAAEAEARAKQLGEKLDRELKEEAVRRKLKAAPNTEQCKGCFHWRRISGFDTLYGCHHILDTGHCRERDGDQCFSKSSKMENPPTPVW